MPERYSRFINAESAQSVVLIYWSN